MQDTTTSLNGAVSAMAADVGVLGNTQSSLTATQTQLSDTATALTGQLSSVQDADVATTLSDLSAIQTQLQASYQDDHERRHAFARKFLARLAKKLRSIHKLLTFMRHDFFEPAKSGNMLSTQRVAVMALNSVNTNMGAMVALQSLNATEAQLAVDPEANLDGLSRRGRHR